MVDMRTIVILFFAWTCSALALTDAEIDKLKTGFQQRRKAVLESQVSEPYPGKDSFVWNRQDYALSALMLDKELEKANQAVIDACNYLLENEDCPDECSMHWKMNLFFRIYEFFNSKSSHYPGRLTEAAENKLIETMWFWLETNSKLSDADIETYKTWRIWGSENHDAMKNTSNWSAAKVLSRLPKYKDKKCKDGKTVEEHFAVWSDYFKVYLKERAIKGGLIETGSHTYPKYTLQGWYNFYDFADQPLLKKRAEYMLDLWWTCWGLEQINGLRGGAKSRTYHDSLKPSRDSSYSMCWFYFDIGRPKSKHPGFMCLITGSYLPADVVYDIALDYDGRGSYEFFTRKLGRICEPVTTEGHNPIYKFDTDRGGLVKYTYVTEGFVMGSFLQEKLTHNDWAWISDQNRWSGVVFAGGKDAAVIPSVEALGNNSRTNYNQYISVQKNGTMLIRKIFEGSKNVGDMRVYFGDDMAVKQMSDSFIVASAEDGYAFVKPAWGSLQKVDENWYKLTDSKSPLIIEAVERSKIKSTAKLVRKAASTAAEVDENKTKAAYESVFYDNRLQLYFDTRLARINNEPVNIYPDFAYKSPYLNAQWADDEIIIEKAGRRKVLDFE